MDEKDTDKTSTNSGETAGLANAVGSALNPAQAKTSALMRILTVLAIVALAGTLWFALEKRGVVSTSLFSFSTDGTVAMVNGTAIKRSDFESSLKQRIQMMAMQGFEEVEAGASEEIRLEVIDTLINGELLRQAAVAGGFSVDDMAVTARYNEIRDGIGGEQALLARMNEVGINEATLRRDIANDALIQQYLESVIDLTQLEVTEAEIVALYEAEGGEAAGLPPLDSVRAEVTSMLSNQKQQMQVLAILDDLRAEAEIDIRI